MFSELLFMEFFGLFLYIQGVRDTYVTKAIMMLDQLNLGYREFVLYLYVHFFQFPTTSYIKYLQLC